MILRAGEYAAELASRYGMGRTFPPVECWRVEPGLGGEPTRITRVKVVMVRGSSDYRERDHSYAEIEGLGPIGIDSRLLFPCDTYRKPCLMPFSDCHGEYNDWGAVKRRKGAARAATPAE